MKKCKNECIVLLANTQGVGAMIITDEIREAIQQAVKIVGNPYRLSKELGTIRHTTIRDWLSGKTKSISDENWDIVREIVENILNEEDIAAPWSIAHDLNERTYMGGFREQLYPFNDSRLDEKIRALSEIEQKRLFICLTNILNFKDKYSGIEIEFSFSATVENSLNESLVGKHCNDYDIEYIDTEND